MTTFLRKVDKPERLHYYERAVVQQEFGLQDGEYLSDLLEDFSTKRGELSIFEVEPGNRDEILLVLCAIAAKSNNWRTTGYLLFDGGVFDNPDIANPVKAEGKTASPAIDDRHYNVPVNTTNILTQFTNNVIDIYLEKDSISKTEMKPLLIKYFQEGMLPNMNDSLRKHLNIP